MTECELIDIIAPFAFARIAVGDVASASALIIVAEIARHPFVGGCRLITVGTECRAGKRISPDRIKILFLCIYGKIFISLKIIDCASGTRPDQIGIIHKKRKNTVHRAFSRGSENINFPAGGAHRISIGIRQRLQFISKKLRSGGYFRNTFSEKKFRIIRPGGISENRKFCTGNFFNPHLKLIGGSFHAFRLNAARKNDFRAGFAVTYNRKR